jgi:Zn-dependent protease with chaperone function
MNPVLLLGVVLLATFGLVSLLLSGLLALAWRAGLSRRSAASIDLMSLRLLPAAGAALIALAVVLPAFVRYEPHREQEAVGPLLILLAAFALACLAHGLWRGWQACRAARALLERWGLSKAGNAECPQAVRVVDDAEPFIAVIGAWRPCIVATESVRAACWPEEFREVLAHEAAHVTARDNLKLLLLVAAPDALAWTPLAATLTARWRDAAERDADQCATGHDTVRRLALASALIKVARLFTSPGRSRPALGMAVAADDVPGRVRRLLGPPAQPLRAVILRVLAGVAVLIPLMALPRYALVHEFLEQLVGFGR